MDHIRKELLKPSEIAPLLGIQRSRVYFLIRTGQLPAVQVGGAWRIPRSAWEAWLRDTERVAMLRLSERAGPCLECGGTGADLEDEHLEAQEAQEAQEGEAD